MESARLTISETRACQMTTQYSVGSIRDALIPEEAGARARRCDL